MIDYRELNYESMNAIKTLYQQHGWTAYLQDDEKLARAFRSSLFMLGAYEGEKLIGFVRCVGDGEHIVMVQDLIVAVDHMRHGIGRKLMQMVYDRFNDVRMLMLITDQADERANGFYQAIGMQKLEQNGCITYMK